jgi:holo-[acyl-carrier protein] synthase
VIVGLGTDIIDIKRIRDSYEQFSTQFVDRILNETERKRFTEKSDPARYLAKQYAVKEAASKALGTGFREGIGWHDIQVEHDDLGAPKLTFAGKAQARYQALGCQHAWLTLSDEKQYVVATVILEKAE